MTLFLSRISTAGRWNLDRLKAISDGVIAIVITLLVLGIEVPSVHDISHTDLGDYLIASIHPILGYVLSFMLIGMYWMQHYAIFHFLTYADRPFVVLNLIFLLFLSFLPFPTGVHAVYRDDELAVILYGVAQILCGLSLFVLWWYATRGLRLVPKSIPPEVLQSMNRRLLLGPVLCLVAIGASFINPWLSRAIYVAIPLCYISQHAVDYGWVKMQLEEEE